MEVNDTESDMLVETDAHNKYMTDTALDTHNRLPNTHTDCVLAISGTLLRLKRIFVELMDEVQKTPDWKSFRFTSSCALCLFLSAASSSSPSPLLVFGGRSVVPLSKSTKKVAGPLFLFHNPPFKTVHPCPLVGRPLLPPPHVSLCHTSIHLSLQTPPHASPNVCQMKK